MRQFLTDPPKFVWTQRPNGSRNTTVFDGCPNRPKIRKMILIGTTKSSYKCDYFWPAFPNPKSGGAANNHLSNCRFAKKQADNLSKFAPMCFEKRPINRRIFFSIEKWPNFDPIWFGKRPINRPKNDKSTNSWCPNSWFKKRQIGAFSLKKRSQKTGGGKKLWRSVVRPGGTFRVKNTKKPWLIIFAQMRDSWCPRLNARTIFIMELLLFFW